MIRAATFLVLFFVGSALFSAGNHLQFCKLLDVAEACVKKSTVHINFKTLSETKHTGATTTEKKCGRSTKAKY